MKYVDLFEASVGERIHGIPVIDSSDDSVIDLSKLKHLGSGIEGDVYGSPSGTSVIRVARLRYKGSIEHNAYVEFVGVCMANTTNPYFPKIKSAKIYKIKHRNEKHVKGSSMDPADRARRNQRQHLSRPSEFLLVVSMEKLAPLRSMESDQLDAAFSELGLTLFDDGESSHLVHANKLGKDPEAIEDVMYNGMVDAKFKTALKLLAPLLAKHGGDLHHDNWMLRGKQIVILDPLSPHLE